MDAYRSGHNEAVLKTVRVNAHGGSNPSASATAGTLRECLFAVSDAEEFEPEGSRLVPRPSSSQA